MEPHAFAYLDDIIVITETYEDHLRCLARVLEIIRTANLTINPEKCEFCCSQVKYLGFLVNRQGLQIDPDKVEPLLNYPIPKNIKQVRRFLGMASWYRRFISEFATISEPITRLLKKDYRWQWTEEQQEAFHTILAALTSAPTLTCPDFEIPFVLQTDASLVGLGAVLTQTKDEIEYVIAFASRALSDPERKYTVTELECLAIIWSIKKFRPYLEGYTFTVITDHSSLRWLHSLKNPTGRLARWALELLEYDFQIIHRKGALHHVPDALSRIHEDSTIAILSSPVLNLNWSDPSDHWYSQRLEAIKKNPTTLPGWRIENDRLYCHKPNAVTSSFVQDLDEWKLVVPRSLRSRMLAECHDDPLSGHLGSEKTYHRLATVYFWPGMYKDTVRYVRRCDKCQRCKVESAAPVGLMRPRNHEQPWSIIAADIMGPFPPSRQGFAYVLVIQDLFTKWIECCALRKATGKKIREALEELVLSRWGAPQTILTDNGTEFINKDLRALVSEYGIYHSTTPPYHPQANPVERVNRVLKTMIVTFLEKDQRDWDRNLAHFRFAYNTAYHASAQCSPAFLNFGRNPTTVSCVGKKIPNPSASTSLDPSPWKIRMEQLTNLRAWIVKNLEEATEKQAFRYNLRRRNRQYKVGDQVLARQHTLSSAAQHYSSKLAPKFAGPLVISRILSPTVYETTNPITRKVAKVHAQDIKPYHD